MNLTRCRPSVALLAKTSKQDIKLIILGKENARKNYKMLAWWILILKKKE